MSDTTLDDHVELAQQLDDRFKALATSLDIQRELQQSTVVKIIIQTFEQDARDAIDALIVTDPEERGKVSHLQARVRAARLIRLALQTKIDHGSSAQRSLIEDDSRMEQEPV